MQISDSCLRKSGAELAYTLSKIIIAKNSFPDRGFSAVANLIYLLKAVELMYKTAFHFNLGAEGLFV